MFLAYHISVEGSPVEEGGGGATLEDDSTLGCLKLALIWAALCLRNVAPIGAIRCTGSNAGKSSKLKSNKILWIKTFEIFWKKWQKLAWLGSVKEREPKSFWKSLNSEEHVKKICFWKTLWTIFDWSTNRFDRSKIKFDQSNSDQASIKPSRFKPKF